MAQHLQTRYTCPTIDSSISDIEVRFKDILSDLISDYAPLPTTAYTGHIDSIWDSFKGCVIDSFEEVRKTNENLRNEAEDIIENLNDQIDGLSEEIDSLTDEIISLSKEINQLNTELSEWD